MSSGRLRQVSYKMFRKSKHICRGYLFVFASGILTVWFLFVSSEQAFSKNKLIMITEKSCPFCRAWERDVGKFYPKTKLANQFPLVRIAAGDNESKFFTYLNEVRGTPTFIFLKDDIEIGRIEGYSDAEMFWWLVDDIVAQFENVK